MFQATDSFTQKELIIMGVSLIAGGAFGAVIKLVADRYHERIPRIHWGIDVVKVFAKEKLGHLEGYLSLKKGEEETHFSFLNIGRVTIQNKSNKDFEEFTFGVTGGDNAKIFDVRGDETDRYHELTCVTEIGLTNPATNVDLKLKPFNRGNTYTFDLFVSYTEDAPPAGDGYIEIGSAMSVRFVEVMDVEVVFSSFLASYLKHLFRLH